jgi:glutathione S-transferase
MTVGLHPKGASMKLYHHPLSSNARKCVIAAQLLGVDLEIAHVDLMKGDNRKPEYLKLNPNGRVPTLVDGDFVLWESAAILQYLGDKKPGNALYPSDARTRADINRWLFWAANHFNVSIATLVFENVLKGMMGAGAPDPGQVKRAEDAFKQFAKVLDDHLASREWLVGKGMTLADIGVSTALMYTPMAKLPLGGFGNVEKWFGRIQALDAWKKTNPPM